MSGVEIPVVDEIENLGADNSRQHCHDAQVPGIIRIDPLLVRITNADPKAGEHAQRNQKSVGWGAEASDLKKSGEHFLVGCKAEGFGRSQFTSEGGVSGKSRPAQPCDGPRMNRR